VLARLFDLLAPFQPTLVGTFPLGLVVDGSDLDVACACDDLDAFEGAVRSALAALGVADARIERLPLPAVVAGFVVDGTPVEIFGQALAVERQAGFRHMIVEGRLLAIGGAALRARVVERKRAGVKTEPAFAQVLGLAGDPYAAVLALEDEPPDVLRRLVERALAGA
jgi:hypothetical protein